MRITLPRLLVCSLAALAVGCGARTEPVATVVPPPLPVQSVAPAPVAQEQRSLPPDPLAPVLAKVEQEFNAGQRELLAGRVVRAREHFDAAVDVLLSQPEGARADARVSAEYERLLDRISALELQALREGDGFTEAQSEPAAIDELLTAAVVERPKPALTTEETVLADLERTPHDLEIPVNDRVLSFVELFQGRLHDFMEAGLQRGLRHLPMIRQIFEEEGLPLDLAYVPLVESAFKTNALSRASARGMWQFMLGTGQEHGLDQNWFIDERSDPEKSTRAAAQYLKTLNGMFDGDWNLALASYNAGPGRLQGAARRARTTDYWKITATSRYLPRETREYVPMIMAAIIIAANPTLYGFEVGAADPLAYEVVTIPNALDLKIIAEWANVSVDHLRELNPELRRTTTPMGEHELKVPLGTAATVQSKLATADPLFVAFNFHTVKRGETLTTIARRYKVTVSELRQANDLSSRARVRLNQSLMIPQRPAAGLPTPTVARATTNAPAAPRATGPITYQVRRGDTLFSIARQFSTTVDVIKQLNRLRSDRINIGDRLTVRR